MKKKEPMTLIEKLKAHIDGTLILDMDTFDPGAPGRESKAHRWVQRTLQQTARTFHMTKPGFRNFARTVLKFASDPKAMAIEPLTPEERKDLFNKFIKIEKEAEDAVPHE